MSSEPIGHLFELVTIFCCGNRVHAQDRCEELAPDERQRVESSLIELPLFLHRIAPDPQVAWKVAESVMGRESVRIYVTQRTPSLLRDPIVDQSDEPSAHPEAFP